MSQVKLICKNPLEIKEINPVNPPNHINPDLRCMEQDSPAWHLKRAFDPFFPAPVEDWQSFADLCTEKSWERDQVLKAAGEAERYFYFILEGSIGVFLWRENHPVCLNFAFEGHFFGDYTSLLTGQPGPLEVMTLEKTRCLRISREHYLALGQTP